MEFIGIIDIFFTLTHRLINQQSIEIESTLHIFADTDVDTDMSMIHTHTVGQSRMDTMETICSFIHRSSAVRY